MRQSNVMAIAGGLIAGIVLAAMLGVGFFGVNVGGDRETDVMLSAATGYGNACELGKATHVRVRHNKHLIWKVENYCPDTQTVMVGDFRQVSAGAASSGCADAGADYPFGEGDRSVTLEPAEVRSDGSIKPTKGRIKLKANSLPEGENARAYAFTICLGGAPADPWVLVER